MTASTRHTVTPRSPYFRPQTPGSKDRAQILLIMQNAGPEVRATVQIRGSGSQVALFRVPGEADRARIRQGFRSGEARALEVMNLNGARVVRPASSGFYFDAPQGQSNR